MPGDVVQIDPGACTYDGKEIRHELKGNNFNWVIHSIEDNGCKATMKKYRVFSTTRMWNPPLVVDTKNLKKEVYLRLTMIKMILMSLYE